MSDSTHSSPGAAHAVDPHDIEHMRAHVRRYLIVGVALILGTLLTVWASLINFGSPAINIVVALIIAIAKGSLVVAFFMHLIDEKKMIYMVMAFTVFFFTALMYLTLTSMQMGNLIHMR